jgi:RNA polymerase primary sigma factor
MRQLKIATQITNRDSQAVEKYLQEISKIPMITPEEETTLAQRIKMGDQRALDKLVQANLRFVVSVAKQYQHQGLSLSDLINEGNLGLIKAAQRFDETKGFKFISYAFGGSVSPFYRLWQNRVVWFVCLKIRWYLQ